MPTSSNGRVRKCLPNRRKLRRAEVLRILAVAMEKSAMASTSGAEDPTKTADSQDEFFNTGRVGRRNAMPDILGNHVTTSTADLPDQLSALTTDDTTSGASTSGASAGSAANPTPSTSASAS